MPSAAFIQLFKHKYPNHQPPQDLQFSIRLLQFIAAFTRRFHPSPTTPSLTVLRELRLENYHRARRYGKPDVDRRSHATPTISQTRLVRNQQHVFKQLLVPKASSGFYGTEDSMSLLDLLPQFMALSAAQVQKSEWIMNELWLNTAAEFMLQAALEQFSTFGQSGWQVVAEAFAWGWNPTLEDSVSDDEKSINRMFKDETEQCEIERWESVKHQYWVAIANDDGIDWDVHLADVAERFPIFRFDGLILDFLHGLFKILKTPVLVQLEQGQLEGLTREETEAFSRQIEFPRRSQRM